MIFLDQNYLYFFRVVVDRQIVSRQYKAELEKNLLILVEIESSLEHESEKEARLFSKKR